MNNNKGFTLIELLVVIIVISVLSAIALPSFLKQRDQARQAEAKSRLAALVKLQILYYPKNDEFVTQDINWGLLETDASRESDNYVYSFLPIVGADGKAVAVINRATPKRDIRAFMAIVGRTFQGTRGEKQTLTIRCQSRSTGEGLELNLDDVDFVEGAPETGGGKISCKGKAVRYGE